VSGVSSRGTPGPLVPRSDWDAGFVAGHPAHAVLGPAAACFSRCSEWPAPSTWRTQLEAGGCAHALFAASGVPISFAPSPPKTRARRRRAPVDVAAIYDERIYVRGEVPSRAASWHDFLNMLVWATFPASKRALNARQRAALRAHVEDGAPRIPGSRTREQDALSMLDEGGVLVLVAGSDATVYAALTEANADAMNVHVAARRAAVLAFGHALHEHLLSTDAPVRALALPLDVTALPRDRAAQVTLADAELASGLASGALLSGPTGAPALPITAALFR
jgi:hypothetical protein